MTTDRLFVIMLVMLIPMTGCFGAVDNADAQDDTTENTNQTIVNNYYNNTTTIVEAPVIEKFTNGGLIDFNLDNYTVPHSGARTYTGYNFSTNAGEVVTIHYLNRDGYLDGVDLRTNCVDGTTGSLSEVNGVDRIVWGSYTNCVHTVELTTNNVNSVANMEKYESGEYTMAWSLVYSIESVTVV